MISDGVLQTGAKYGPALLTAPLGLLDPKTAAIAFGMVAGWFAIAGVMVEQQRTISEIRRAMVVSLLIGGGGALAAAYAVDRLHLSTIEAALIAFTIAFGGVKSIKMITGMVWRAARWLVDSLIDDAEKRGRERQRAHLESIENGQRDLERIDRKLKERADDEFI